MSDTPNNTNIFIAFSSKERKLADILLLKLNGIEKKYNLVIWHKGLIKIGNVKKVIIQKKLQEANIVLLVVSDNFLKEDYFKTIKNQLKKTNDSKIIPILLKNSKWKSDNFISQFKPLPKDEKPIITKGKQKKAQDKDYDDVIIEIKELLSEKVTDKPINLNKQNQNESSTQDRKWNLLKIIGGIISFITFVGVIAGLNADLPNLINTITGKSSGVKSDTITTRTSHSIIQNSIFSEDDTLFKVLITRFEPNVNKDDDTFCIGRSILESFIQLKRKGLPVNPKYIDEIASPKYPEDADIMQKRYNADVLIYGLANEIQEDCTSANVCFRYVVANTIMSNLDNSKDKKRVKHDIQYEKLSHNDIEQGKLSVDEQSMEAWANGLVFLKGNDKESFFAEIEKMAADIAHLPKNEQANRFFSQAEVYFYSGEIEKTIVSLTRAIKANPNDDKLYNNRGASYSNDLNEYEKAIMDFSKAIELNPNNYMAFANRGQVYNILGQYEKAIADLNISIELNSYNSINYERRGKAFFEMKEYQKAILDFNKSIDLNSKNVSIYSIRGTAYYNLKDFQKAIADFSKEIKLNSNNVNAYLNRAVSYRAIKKYKIAVSDFSIAIKLDSINPNPYVDRGAIYSNKLKEYEKAIMDFNEAIKLNPKENTAYFNRAITFQRLKEYEKAILDFNKVIELNPNYVKAYLSRGIFYGEISEYKKAISDFNKAIEMEPDYAYAYYCRGASYQSLRELVKANQDFNKAKKLGYDVKPMIEVVD